MDLFTSIENVLGSDAIEPESLLSFKQKSLLKSVFEQYKAQYDVAWPQDDAEVKRVISLLNLFLN